MDQINRIRNYPVMGELTATNYPSVSARLTWQEASKTLSEPAVPLPPSGTMLIPPKPM